MEIPNTTAQEAVTATVVSKPVQIKSFNFSLCNTPQQFEAHSVIRDIIGSNKIGVYDFDEVYAPYTEAYKTEDEAFRHIRHYQETGELTQLNAKRVKLFIYIKQLITAELKSPIADKKAAAEHIKPIIDLYHDANKQDYIAQSATIANFLKDIQMPIYMEDITKLGIATALTELSTTNQNFIETYNYRNDIKAQNEEIELLDRARIATDRAYHYVAQAINSIFLANHYGDEDAIVDSTCRTIINSINSYLSQLELIVTSHHSRLAKKEHEPKAYSTSKSIVIKYLPRGASYKVVDIAQKIIAEGISGGNRIEISAPVGEYTVTLNEIAWEKNPVIVK